MPLTTGENYLVFKLLVTGLFYYKVKDVSYLGLD